MIMGLADGHAGWLPQLLDAVRGGLCAGLLAGSALMRGAGADRVLRRHWRASGWRGEQRCAVGVVKGRPGRMRWCGESSGQRGGRDRNCPGGGAAEVSHIAVVELPSSDCAGAPLSSLRESDK